jgi:hypothetical protein
MSRFDKFLDEDTSKQTHIPLKRKRSLVVQPKNQVQVKSFKSVKISEDSYALINLIKTSTKKKHFEIMAAALEMYASAVSETDQNFRAMKSVLTSDPNIAPRQTSIDDFLED